MSKRTKKKLFIYMGKKLSEAEQNRLITENMKFSADVAAGFLGSKGIPLDELKAQAALNLVVAARSFSPPGNFRDYAWRCIHNGLKNFIAGWQNFDELVWPEDEDERDYFEWTIWPWAAPYENWAGLIASPEEIQLQFEALSGKQRAFENAMISLKKRDREIIWAKFFRQPNQSIQSIAREHKLSYWNVVKIIDRSLKKISEIVESIESRAAA